MLEIMPPKIINLGERRLAYDEVSPANPRGTIILITGLASKRQGWYNQLHEFGKYYRTIALDNRDAGDSDATPAPYTVADQAEDVAALMGILGIERAVVIGISMGGFISLELTLRHPELVEKLVLVSTSAGGITNVPASPSLWPMLLMRRKGMEPGALARRVYNQIMGPGYAPQHPEIMDSIAELARYKPMTREAYARQLRACLRHNAAGRLGQIKVPTLVIHGNRDRLVPFANGRFLARRIPGAKLLVYPNVGHVPIIEKADQFNRDVLAFLEGKM